jgi:hypothetical protein
MISQAQMQQSISDYRAKLARITMLGLLALSTGDVIHWDAEAMTAPDVADADKIINGSY